MSLLATYQHIPYHLSSGLLDNFARRQHGARRCIVCSADIKKPACGRLLGDCLSLFLTNLTSLQIAQPTLRQAE